VQNDEVEEAISMVNQVNIEKLLIMKLGCKLNGNFSDIGSYLIYAPSG